MGKYIGVKIVEAEAMGLHDFNENHNHNKVITSTQGNEGYKVVYPDGYVNTTVVAPRACYSICRPYGDNGRDGKQWTDQKHTWNHQP